MVVVDGRAELHLKSVRRQSSFQIVNENKMEGIAKSGILVQGVVRRLED
jgi:hypothetical protein